MNRIKRYFQLKNNIVLAGAFILITIAGCEKYIIESTEIDPNDPRSFQTEILPIFERNACASCHGGAIKPDLRSENAYTSLTVGGYVSVTNPAGSKLYDKLVNSSSHQPKTSVDEEKFILYWITQGAKNN